MFDETRLNEKLRAIEALHAGAATEGERDAAERARERIAARLTEVQNEQQLEWQFSLNPWSYRLLLALARRYGLRPYRYRRRRRTTLVIKASRSFMESFVPELNAMNATLEEHLAAVADRVVREVLHADRSEAAVVDGEPRQLQAAPAAAASGE